jgi:glutamyl-tRNA synthetase
VHHSNARFDMAKCVWLNQQHLRALSGAALLEHSRSWMEKAGLVINDPEYAAKALESVKEKVSLASEFPAWVHFYFRDDFPMEDEASGKLKANAQSGALLQALGAALAKTGDWNQTALGEAINTVAAEQKVKPGALMPLLRASLSGQMRGPDVKLMMEILGQERALERIRRAAEVKG